MSTATITQPVSLVKAYVRQPWQRDQYWVFNEDEGGTTTVYSGWTSDYSEIRRIAAQEEGYETYHNGDLEPYTRVTSGPDCDGTRSEYLIIFRKAPSSKLADRIDNTQKMYRSDPSFWYTDFTDQEPADKRDSALTMELGYRLMAGNDLLRTSR